MEEQKGRHSMEEQEGGQSMEGILGMELTPEQANDLDTLEDKLDDFLDSYYEFRDKHSVWLGWDVVGYGLVFKVMPCGDFQQGSISERGQAKTCADGFWMS